MKVSDARISALFLGVVCVFALLAARLVQIQLLEHETFARGAVEQQYKQVEVEARRGRVYDRNLRLLATTVPCPSVFVNPTEAPNLRYLAGTLSDALGVDAGALYGTLSAKAGRQFMWVKRRISPSEYQAFLSLTPVQRSGAYVRWERKRTYPLGRHASHVLGFVDIDNQGRLGIESALQEELAGRAGRETLATDGKGNLRVIYQACDEPATPGLSAVLTIDSTIQEMVEEEIAKGFEERQPEAVMALVMRTETGEILALANLPAFDPNKPGADPPTHLMDRAVQTRYEPGSIFKPFILSAALDKDAVSLSERFFCYNGVYRTGKRILHDHHPYGWLTAAEIVIHSSNIGITRIGEALGASRQQECLAAFRIGARTGVELPGEISGQVTPARKWSYYTSTSVPMGHEVAATPIRLLAAFNAIANGGVLVEPRVVKAVVDDQLRIVRTPEAAATTRVISEGTAKRMMGEVLAEVVEQGTGKQAKLDRWKLAGKTGTAQKILEDGTYSHSRYIASFLCAAPAERTVATILVMFDAPTKGASLYGGSVAAPVASAIARRVLEYYDIPPSEDGSTSTFARASRTEAGR
ncbi:MAG: penicillin-binding protein 2 [Planctomycetota bacterium]